MTSQVPEQINKQTDVSHSNIYEIGALHFEHEFNINGISCLLMTGQQIWFLSFKVL